MIPGYKTIIEPFRIKTVEPIRVTSEEERVQILKEAYYNLFLIKAEDVLIDLLTDSGTGAMSSEQWAAMMLGDESYAGSKSYFDFLSVAKELFGFGYIYPTHQGRAAERILFSIIGGKGKYIPNNTHFDTTRANVESTGTGAVDFVIPEGKDISSEHPFKGNMDIEALEGFIQEKGAENIPLCMLTITNNSGGGQPVSLENIKATKTLCQQYNIPLFLDACRFAENAYFIKMREAGYENKSIKSIVQEIFSYADGCTISSKKDGMVNIGGVLACNDSDLAKKIEEQEILTEGFPTYGGLAGRDLGAMAQGFKEVISEEYLEYRIHSTWYLGRGLKKAGIPILEPMGGHAIYIDAQKFLPNIPREQFPGHALACALYSIGGVRGVEIGTLMFGEHAQMELVRLAIPRRVYAQSHVDYVIEVGEKLVANKNQINGYKIIEAPKSLRHFTAKLAPC